MSDQRLIDATAMMRRWGLDNATKYGNSTADEREFSYSMMSMYEIADMIEDEPTVDPVRHGKWIEHDGDFLLKVYKCSECKDDPYWEHHFGSGYENFCENCGAKMDKEG